MYISKYFTNEEIDQRLLEGYYDDFVKAGFEGSKEEFFAFVLSIKQCVVKEEGKGLSTNDFTDEYKQKLESMGWTTRYLEDLEFTEEAIPVEHSVLTFVQNPINQPSGQDIYDVGFDVPQEDLVLGKIYESIFILKPTYDTQIIIPLRHNIQESGEKFLIGGKWNYVKFTWAVTAYEEGTATGYINIEVHTDRGSKSESVWSVGTGLHSALLPESGSQASGEYSVAEGNETVASGNWSHAEGWSTEASGQASHAEGLFTKTLNQGEHASGRYNFSRAMSSVRGGTIFSVGNGTSESGRFNIMELTFADALFLYGLGGYDGKTIDESTESVQDIILVEALSNEEINNLIPELI